MSGFTLTIRLGNDAMKTPEDVGIALEYIAQRLCKGEEQGTILDDNGNKVGEFEGEFPEVED